MQFAHSVTDKVNSTDRMLNFRRIIIYSAITKKSNWIGKTRMTQSIRLYSKGSENGEKSKDLNRLSSLELNDLSAAENIDSKKCEDKFPKSISEASQELHRELDESIETELCFTYTCKECGTRNSKIIPKLAYLKGVVIVRCEKCENTQLVADNSNVNGKKKVEDILAENSEKSENVQHVSMQEFFGIKDEAISNDKNKVETQRNEVDKINSDTKIKIEQPKEKSTFWMYFLGNARIIKQKLGNMLTKPEKK